MNRDVRPRFRLCIAILLSLTTIAAAAPPKLNYLFPAGGQRGQTIDVTANGSWDAWPVTAWTSRPGLEITAAADKGKLQVKVDEKAEPGLVWIRLANQEGATSIKPFVVGTLPEVNEVEPNDDSAKPQLLDGSRVVNGRLGKREDCDVFAISLTQGQTLVASLQANRDLGSGVDAVLQVCFGDRFVMQQNDDANGIDPLIAFTAPANGTYAVRVFGFPATPDSSISFAGNDAFIYRLTMTTTGYIDHVFPMAVTRGKSQEVQLDGWNIPETARRTVIAETNAEGVRAFHPDLVNAIELPSVSYESLTESKTTDRAQPQTVPVPSVVTGTIEALKEEDFFAFTAKKGESLKLSVESDELGYLLDPVLSVRDKDGKILAEADDARRARDPELPFTVPADGEYRATVRDVHGHGGPRYVYRLTIQPAQSDFQLTLTPDTYIVKAGEKTEVTVTIDRNKGFDREVEISALELPTGVTIEAMKSQKDGPTAKSVKLVLQANAEAQSGAFRIVGKVAGEPVIERVAKLKGDGIPESLSHAWVTVSK